MTHNELQITRPTTLSKLLQNLQTPGVVERGHFGHDCELFVLAEPEDQLDSEFPLQMYNVRCK